MSSFTNASKNNESLSNTAKGSNPTWDEMTGTWNDTTGTWDDPDSISLANASKNNVNLTNEAE